MSRRGAGRSAAAGRVADAERLVRCFQVKIGGRSNLLGSLKTAQLALKNRLNKEQEQRILVFVGSPVRQLRLLAVSLRAAPRHLRWLTAAALWRRSRRTSRS